jgi:nuclear transport factor 2 (NTF2) superfamily protein
VKRRKRGSLTISARSGYFSFRKVSKSLRQLKTAVTKISIYSNFAEIVKEPKKIMEFPDGRRCRALKYRENSEDEKYHMDILPSVIDSDYRRDFKRLFSEKVFDKSIVQKLAFRITDKERDHKTETDATEWLKSNPFGYAKWFFDRAEQGQVEKRFSLKASIQEVPNF